VALGTIVTGGTLFDIYQLSGAWSSVGPIPHGLFQTFAKDSTLLTGIGTLLTAAGFLLVFVGVALASRGPQTAWHGVTRRVFMALLLGGLLVAAGLVALGLLALYSYAPSPFDFQTYYSIDLGARIVEAVGFFVAFVGVAVAFRART